MGARAGEVGDGMVVYVDTLFLLNAVVDYLLLLAAARLAGEPLRRLRFALGAALGGGYAVAIFLPGCAFLSAPLWRGASALAMVAVAYGGSRRLLRQGLLFVALACAFGGGVLAIGLMGGTPLALGGGVIYTPMDLKVVLLSAAACYLVLTLVFQRLGRHTAAGGELARARLTLGERSVEVTALIDTGNTLTDPVSGRPAMVAEGEALAPLFPGLSRPERGDLLDPAAGLARLSAGPLRGRLRLLPYRAVGVERGRLLAVRADCLELDGRGRGPVLVALSPTPVSDGGGYRALIGPLEG